jgi:hypothetical protein
MKQSKQRNKNMLSQSQQNTLLELYAQGVKKREIARPAKLLSSERVQGASFQLRPGAIQRAKKAEPYRQQILELLAR